MRTTPRLLALREKHKDHDPRCHADEVFFYGVSLARLGQMDAAIAQLEHTLLLQEKLSEPLPVAVENLSILSRVHATKGNFNRAMELARKALSMNKNLNGDDETERKEIKAYLSELKKAALTPEIAKTYPWFSAFAYEATGMI